MRRLLLVLLVACAPAFAAAQELVVFVSASSPIRALTREQAQQLFLGRPANLGGLDRPTPLDQPDGPLRDAFYERLAGRSPSQMKAYWSRLVFTGKGEPPREVPGDSLVKEVARDPRLVGYAMKRELDASVRAVLVVP
jgi:hypothetical protein